MVGKEKAIEIIKNLTATIKRLSTQRRMNTVESQSTAFKTSRANLNELKRRRTELITKFKLNGTDY
jgi:hypothetical protein